MYLNPVTIGKRIISPGGALKLFAFGCVHYGTPSHDHNLWIDFLKRLESTPDAVCFGMGDYFDFARTRTRNKLVIFDEEDTFYEGQDDMVNGQLVNPFCAEIKRFCPSFSSKVICLIEGNHYYRYGSGSLSGHTSTEEISRILGVPYAGFLAGVTLTVYRSINSGKTSSGQNMNIWLNHGSGISGTTAESALASLKRKVADWEDLDVILAGHKHMLDKSTRCRLRWTQSGEKRLYDSVGFAALTGCFKIAYMRGASSTSYEEKQAYPPHQRGWLECSARFERIQVEGREMPQRWKFYEFNC